MEKRALSDEEVEALLRGEVPAARGDLIDLAVAMQEVREAVPPRAPVPSSALIAWLSAGRQAVDVEPSAVRRTRPRAVAWIAGLGLGAQAALGATGAAAVGAGAGLTGVLPSEAQLLVDDFLGFDRAGDVAEPTDGEPGAPNARPTTGATDAGSPSEQGTDGEPVDGADPEGFEEPGPGEPGTDEPAVQQPGGQSTDVSPETTGADVPVEPSRGGTTGTAGTGSPTSEADPSPTPAETPTDPPPGTPAEPGETETPEDGVTDGPTDEAPDDELTSSGPGTAPSEPGAEETATGSGNEDWVGEGIGEKTGGKSAEGGGGTEAGTGQGAAGRGSGISARSGTDDRLSDDGRTSGRTSGRNGRGSGPGSNGGPGRQQG